MKCENCGHTKKRIRALKYEEKDGMKVCSRCNESKPFDQYNKHSNTSERLRPECKGCRKIINAAVYDKRKLKQQATKETAN